jgi:hypothetical protein
MAVQLYWDQNNPDILILDLGSGWTWEDFHAAVERGIEMAQSVTTPVYAISIPGARFPSPVGILGHFNLVMQHLPANMVLVVIVAENYFIETVNRIFFRVSPAAGAISRIARTLDEARQIIAEHRANHKGVP